MKVRWLPAAKEDRSNVMDYIAAGNPQAAAKMDELFDAAVARLSRHPRIGRPGKIQGTRELIPHENYRLVYETDGDIIWILALVHTSRQWPPAHE